MKYEANCTYLFRDGDLVLKEYPKGTPISKMPKLWVNGSWLYGNNDDNFQREAMKNTHYSQGDLRVYATTHLTAGKTILANGFIGWFPAYMIQPEHNEYGEVAP